VQFAVLSSFLEDEHFYDPSIVGKERRGYRVAHHCCCGGTADIKYRQCTTTISFAKKVYIAKDK
jgi:hypothetical protein